MVEHVPTPDYAAAVRWLASFIPHVAALHPAFHAAFHERSHRHAIPEEFYQEYDVRR